MQLGGIAEFSTQCVAETRSYDEGTVCLLAIATVASALEGPQDHLIDTNKKLRSRRDLTVKTFNSIPRMSCVSPRGAFYAFPRLDIPEGDDVFVKGLLFEKQVLVVHGSGFGSVRGANTSALYFCRMKKH